MFPAESLALYDMVYVPAFDVLTVPVTITTQFGSLLSIHVAPGSVQVFPISSVTVPSPASVTVGGVSSGSSGNRISLFFVNGIHSRVPFGFLLAVSPSNVTIYCCHGVISTSVTNVSEMRNLHGAFHDLVLALHLRPRMPSLSSTLYAIVAEVGERLTSFRSDMIEAVSIYRVPIYDGDILVVVLLSIVTFV